MKNGDIHCEMGPGQNEAVPIICSTIEGLVGEIHLCRQLIHSACVGNTRDKIVKIQITVEEFHYFFKLFFWLTFSFLK